MAEPASNEEWRVWGDVDPMFGVAAWSGRRRTDATPWTVDEFYELGRRDWGDFWRLWRAAHPVATDAVMEIGCGAGRISGPLADTFTVVHALDVSPGMLEFARRNCTSPNIEWRLYDGLRPPLEDRAVDAVFSAHVLQHLSSEDLVWRLCAESFRTLRPGGSLCLHMQIHAFPPVNRLFSRFARRTYGWFLELSAIKTAMRRFAMRRGWEPCMHGISVERDDVFRHLTAIGFADVAISTILMSSNGSAHTCVLARRPSCPGASARAAGPARTSSARC